MASRDQSPAVPGDRLDDSSPSPTTTDAPAGASGRARLPVRLLELVAGAERRRRLRLLQWVTAGGVYAVAALLMAVGVRSGWMDRDHLLAWSAFVCAGLAFAYVALRSGWSERFADPSLTQWQIVMGIVAVSWGYLISGPVRTVALFPLLLIFAFGAFALEGRKIARLALFASASVVVVTTLQALNPSPGRDLPLQSTLPVDWINLAMSLALLLALAVLAARLSALRTALGAKREALAHALDEVRRLATTDELTGLPNRRSMMGHLAEFHLQATSSGAGYCVAVIDIDHFKRINDRLGHAQGDALLRAFATRARAAVQHSDVIGRWGGEEFLLLMPTRSPEQARERVEALLAAMRGVRAGDWSLSFSAGVACFRPGDDAAALLQRADQAMYAAKQAGRARVELAH